MQLKIFKRSLRDSLKHALFTMLMMIGVIVSIFSMTVIVAIGDGTKMEIIHVLQGFGFGGDVMMVAAGGGRIFRHRPSNVKTLTVADAQALKRFPFVKEVAPRQGMRSYPIHYMGRSFHTRILGVTPAYLKVGNYQIALGRPLSQKDLRDHRKVCLIGRTVADELFPGHRAAALGKFIQIGKFFFRIKGVLSEKGQLGRFDMDDRILIPLTTSSALFIRDTYLHAISVKLIGTKNIAAYQKIVKAFLRKRHHLSPSEPDDFRVVTSLDVVRIVNRSSRDLTRLLVRIMIISLLVSGIIIMNVMLASISERRVEIGIKRALGATRNDILAQFLFEAIWLSLLGSLIGSALGAIVATFMKSMIPVSITLRPFVLAVIFGILIGTVSGAFPAYRAGQTDPIRAILGGRS
jgi:putative ABC transport system permease protein